MITTLQSWNNFSNFSNINSINIQKENFYTNLNVIFNIKKCYSLWSSCLSLKEAFFTVAFMLTVMLLIVFGNLMVVLTVNNDQKLQSQRQNWLIVSLALADLLVGLLIMPLSMIYEIVGIWVFGNFLCELWLALDVLFVTASILHICIISLDRYWSVTRPLTYPIKRTPLRICIMIGVAWLVSFLICFPPLLGWKAQRNPGECSVSRNLGYVLYSSLGSFYIPVGILVIVYWRIYVITKNHSRQRLKDTQKTDETLFQLTTNNSINRKYSLKNNQKLFFRNKHKLKNFSMNKCNSLSSVPEIQSTQEYIFATDETVDNSQNFINFDQKTQENLSYGELSELNLSNNKIFLNKKRQLLKIKERQATFLLGLILSAFIVSWLPFFIMYVLGAFGYQAPIIFYKFFFWLGYCNSAINPVIYTIFNREFKKALFRFLRRYRKYFLFVKQHAY